jgi:hypothetical protein
VGGFHRRSVKQREQPSLVRQQGLTINPVFDVISVSEDFYDVGIASVGHLVFGVISRPHLKRIRLKPSNNVSWAFMFVNHSLQVVTRVPRLSVMNCFLVLSGTSKRHLDLFIE